MTSLNQTMNAKRTVRSEDIDWEPIFEQITGSVEAPVSHLTLSHQLKNTHDLDSNEAWGVVTDASKRGELLQVIVECFPEIHRKYYFIPRVRFEDAGRVFVPFWDCVLEEVIRGDGWFSRSNLQDWIRERNDEDVSERTLAAIDDHLEAITPAYTPKQSMKETKIRSDTMRLYQKLSKVSDATNTDISDFDTDTMSV
ncbi:hypothetical protein DM867_00225 [Halosegnis rubeus]|uniref:Uncharacterized protein n=1 Tax=Halosegnis rubeus TaxID=2212850 RepID=A0A5N5UDV1_9EURY|nr:hypothetical protein [Halosegnis rubeus]KAB7515612.1 hypothetical protein DM867_00225 [Halosegnis rubeus]